MSGEVPGSRGLAAPQLFSFLWQRRQMLGATISHEFSDRYSGSLLGLFWVVLFPLLFLSIYVAVYTLVFRVRLEDGTPMDYVHYVFCGLVPYFAMLEAANQAANAIRTNSAAIRGSLVPIELIPATVAGVAMVTGVIGLVLIVILSVILGRLSLNVLLLPVVLVLHAALFLGLSCALAVIGALIRDVSYVVSLSGLMLLFLSPIAYTSSMLPPVLWFLRDLNPVYYVIEAYRMALHYQTAPNWPRFAIFALMCLGMLFVGAAILRRYKGIAADNA